MNATTKTSNSVKSIGKTGSFVRGDLYDSTMGDADRDPDNPPPSGPPTHWIDTDVMLEVYSHGDLFNAWDAYERGEVPIGEVETRRLRLQGSLWMAMALCKVGARSVTYRHENERNIKRIAPPGSKRGVWTSAIVWMLGDHGVFDGWEKHMTNDAEALSDRQRDKHMAAECRDAKLVLISRDAKLIREALALGVDAAKPEEYAARFLKREEASAMFQQRLWDAVMRYVSKSKAGEEVRCFNAGCAARDAFAAVWQSPSQPWFK
jgi:hypothetical protein